MGKAQHGRDAITFNTFTDTVLDEKDRKIILEMINEFRKKNHDPIFYISRVAILAAHKELRDAFARHETLIINAVEKDDDR
jgi:hypothetical protein